MGKAPHLLIPAAIGVAAFACAQGFAVAQDMGASPLPAASSGASAPAPPASDWQAARSQIIGTGHRDPAIVPVIAEWRRLQQSDMLGFGAYASFLLAHSGWPGEDRMRDVAERAINPASYDQGQVIAFFARFPPRSATGFARLSVALAGAGRMDEARVAARQAWTGGVLSMDDEARVLSLSAAGFSADDHLRHADQALWARNAAAAERVLAYLSPTRRPLIEARIAMQRRAPDASLRMAAVDPIGATDAGYLIDKSRWLFALNDWSASRAVLANRPALSSPATDPARWYDYLLSQARAAASDGQWAVAYAIAAKVDDAYPAGTDVSDSPLAVRDDYTSLTWLAGTAALNKLGQPADAVGMFARYAGGARSPQTISKGQYWAGRAAMSAGRTDEAQTWFRKASAFADQYYGQLALERIGQPVPVPGTANRPVEISAATRSTFQQRSIVRAARELGASGQWQEQTRMLRAIAANAVTDEDAILAAELARALARPDLGVMVGRKALASGLPGYGEASFPRVPVPADHQFNWTMIHAIARQESQFDREIVSHAGARGLMQLMPGTARETAGKIGVGYDLSALYDPQYNIRLGSTYFRNMLDYYRGSYPLAVAAYNAGPGNVNKWLRSNGDPRLPGVDIVQWVEDIPIYETRNYVQRVLENAVVYDQLNPGAGGLRIAAPLSRYLGKQQPG